MRLLSALLLILAVAVLLVESVPSVKKVAPKTPAPKITVDVPKYTKVTCKGPDHTTVVDNYEQRVRALLTAMKSTEERAFENEYGLKFGSQCKGKKLYYDDRMVIEPKDSDETEDPEDSYGIAVIFAYGDETTKLLRIYCGTVQEEVGKLVDDNNGGGSLETYQIKCTESKASLLTRLRNSKKTP